MVQKRPSFGDLLTRLIENAPVGRTLEADGKTLEELASKAVLTTTNVTRVLATMGLDPLAFETRYGCSREEFANGLKTIYEQLHRESGRAGKNLERLRGALGFICFTTTAMSTAERRGAERVPASVLMSLQEFLSDCAVTALFSKLYRPAQHRAGESSDASEATNSRLSQGYWKSLDLESLRVHQIGTTSFILKCNVATLRGRQCALKCLLFPYTDVPNIAEATRKYAITYPAGDVPSTALVHSSCDKWILMDFIPGFTLREELDAVGKRSDSARAPLLRINLLKSIGPQLLDALYLIHQKDIWHLDLTPSNIIVIRKPDIEKPSERGHRVVEPGAVEQLLLIDLGRNYLYTRKAGLAESTESLFVAPEVKDDHPVQNSDLYSLGMILVELIDPKGALGGTIPDTLYQYAPYLARFIEDLIDKAPENRLLIFGRDNGRKTSDQEKIYSSLRSAFEDELKVLPSDAETGPRRPGWLRTLTELLLPSQSQVRNRLRLWRTTQSRHTEIATNSGYLLGWSVVCAGAWYIIFTVAVLWGLRDFGIDAWAKSITITQKAANSQPYLPFIDSLRAPNYAIHDWRVNFPARILAFSIGLAGTKYYQNILAGLTTRPLNGWLARVTEILLRYTSFAVLIPVLIGNLIQPRWWPWLVCIGYTPPLIMGYLCYMLATRSLDKARSLSLSTVPTLTDPALKAYGQWSTSLASLIVFGLGVASGLRAHVLHDVWVYALGLVGVNLIINYGVKCTYFGPSVRGSLTRAFIAGERIAARQRKDGKGQPQKID
jgi:serine/threonine protein kinase